MADTRFEFCFHPAFRVPAALVGVTPASAWVELEEDRLVARFGPWVVRTKLSNVESASVTGPYAWPKVIGPAHVSFTDRGLTFATNPDEGVCIRFVRPVRGIDPLGVVRHPALTVTVADAAVLAELLDRPAHDPTRTHADDDGVVTADELVEEAATELRSMTAAELRRRARELGVRGASRMTKSELIEHLS